MAHKLHASLKDTDKGWKAITERLKQIEESYVKVGVLADTEAGGMHEIDPKTGQSAALTLAELAVVHEFGTQDGHIPERSFLRSTFDETHPQLAELGQKLIRGVIDGKIDVEKALGVMGSKLATDTKNKITTGEGVPPPNAESTIKAKGSDRPLVDTGRLVNAITYQVTVGGGHGGHGGHED